MTVESLLVALCTYNERENIEALLPEIWRVVPHAHVLVVDDNATNRHILEEIVNNWGMRPTSAAGVRASRSHRS